MSEAKRASARAAWLSAAAALLVLLVCNASRAAEIDRELGVELEAIAAEAELGSLPCARQGRLEVPISFRFRQESGRRASAFSFSLPVADTLVVDILSRYERYPSWFLRRRDGSPNLHAFAVDSEGRGYLQVAAADGFRLETEVRELNEAGYRGVDLDIDAGWGVLKGRLLLAVRPALRCGEAGSEIVGRLTWRMGILGTLLPASLKNLPGALALTIRDDLLARLIEESPELESRMTSPFSGSLQSQEARILRPWIVEGRGSRAQSESLRDYLQAASGSYLVTGWWAAQRGATLEAPARTSTKIGSGFRYEVDLAMKRRGYDLLRVWQPVSQGPEAGSSAP